MSPTNPKPTPNDFKKIQALLTYIGGQWCGRRIQNPLPSIKNHVKVILNKEIIGGAILNFNCSR